MTQLTIPVKWMLPAILVMVFSPVLSILASVMIADNNAREIQAKSATQQRIAEDKARETARVVTCQLFGAILDSYKETPPTTHAGENVRDTWLNLYKLSRCQPPRGK